MLSCLFSLASTAQTSVGNLHALQVIMPFANQFTWQWFEDEDRRGTLRMDVLTTLLQNYLDAAMSPLLSGAEIGVCAADTGSELLKRFPTLRLLLIDPCNL